jgi:pimeloyl-ACP methyl ester carboxylesterase
MTAVVWLGRILRNLFLRGWYGALFRLPFVSRPALLRVFATPFPLRAVGAPLEVEAGQREIWFEGQKPFRVVALGQGPCVFLVHGWGGSPAQMLTLGHLVAARGFEAVLVELPAHGASRGRTTNAHEAAVAISVVARKLGQPRAIIAHSFGALATKLALEMGVQANKLVFVAPMPSLRWAAADFARKVGVSTERMAEFACQYAVRLGLEPSHLDLKHQSSGPSRPLLIIHDRGDRTIPFVESEQVASVWASSALVETDGLGHTRLLASAAVHERALEFALS